MRSKIQTDTFFSMQILLYCPPGTSLPLPHGQRCALCDAFCPKSQVVVSKVTENRVQICTLSLFLQVSCKTSAISACNTMLVVYCASYNSGEIAPFTTTEFVDWEAQICFPMDTDILKDAFPPFHSPAPGKVHLSTRSGQVTCLQKPGGFSKVP